MRKKPQDSQNSDYWRHWNSPAWSYGWYDNSWNGYQEHGNAAYDGYGSPGDSFQTPPPKRTFVRADSYASSLSDGTEKSLRRASTVDQLDADTRSNIEAALGHIPEGPQKEALLRWMLPPCSVSGLSEPCSPESVVERKVETPGNPPMAKKALEQELHSVSTETGQKAKEAPEAPSTAPQQAEQAGNAANAKAPPTAETLSTVPKQPETNTTTTPDDKQVDDKKMERRPADAETKDEDDKDKAKEATSVPETAAQQQKPPMQPADANLEAAAEPKNNPDKTAPAVANETQPAGSNAADAPATASAPPKQPETSTAPDDTQAGEKIEAPQAADTQDSQESNEKAKEDAISQKLAEATGIQEKLAAMAAAKIAEEKEEQEKEAASARAKRKANEAQLKDLKPTSKAAAKAKEASQGAKRKAEDATHDEEKAKAARVAENQGEAEASDTEEDEEAKHLEAKKKKARATYMRFYRSMRGFNLSFVIQTET